MTATARVIQFGSISKAANLPRLVVDVMVGASTEHNFWSGLARNLADGGVFVATHNTVPIGTLVDLQLVLGDEPAPIALLAVVRSILPYSSDDIAPGLVLQFVNIDRASLAKIRTFVAGARPPLFFDFE